MIVLIRCNNITTDPRVEKYLRYYATNNIDYKVIGWDRLGENLTFENTIYFDLISGYNIGGIKAAINRFFWMMFVIKQLFILKKQVSTIHGCDLDGVFPAIVFKLVTQKKIKVIFDVFDWFSDTLSNQSILIRRIFRYMEKVSITHSDEIIICEEERINQIPYKLRKEARILQNIPSFETSDFLHKKEKYSFNNNKITIAYVGGFYRERFIDELLQIAEEGYINLNIAGYGDKKIENKCLLLSKLSNVKYYGQVGYKEGLNIMYNSDVICAIYCTTNKNHVFAAPNKYYEALMLGKPLISNTGTILSAKILKNQVGFIIKESIDELRKLIIGITEKEINKFSMNANLLWIKTYKNKVDDFLINTYSKMIR